VHGPGNVGYLNSIVAISAGESHNLALKSDGTVWAWGWNALGQLGNGTTNDAHTPVQVSVVSNVVAISGRGYHCLALEADGSLWAWGWNAGGQLGDGTTTSALLPERVAGINKPVMISAAYKTSLVLFSNGTIKVWGTDTKGELGQGTFHNFSYTPIPVPGISNVVSISAGFQEPEALLSDGTIWIWGWNNLGQLGDGTNLDTSVPAPVLGLTNMIFAGQTGDRDSCAIGAGHVVYTWGRNYNGQLGIGTTDDVVHPVPVALPHFGNGYVTMVQTPDWHSLALESDGTLWAWGSNEHGQGGNGTTNDQYSPMVVQWPAVPPPAPIQINLTNAGKQTDDSFQFSFTNAPGTQFTVLSAASLAVPFANWTPIGSVSEISPGLFRFKDPVASSRPAQLYRVISP
jgi:alpha-tubulin suppressor-like RCC1 family protein